MTEELANVVRLPPAEQRLLERVRELQLNSKAANTVKAYRSDLADFATWCDSRGRAVLPATPETVSLYLADLAEHGAALSTIERRASAISQMHQAAGHTPPPTHDWHVRQLRQGLRRKLGTAPKGQRRALTARELRRLVQAAPEDTRAGLRDRALLLVGHLGAFRRSALVALDREDVEWTDHGLLLLIRRDKTDQEGDGREVGIPWQPSPETCPVRALRAWVEAAGIVAGPLWQAVDRWDNLEPGRLSDQSVARIVKRACRRAGIDPTRYAAHSLRAGLATSAAEAGAPRDAIKRQGGWRSDRQMEGYIRHGTVFIDNAAGFVRV